MSPVNPQAFISPAARYGAAAANPGMIGKQYDPSVGYVVAPSVPQQGPTASPWAALGGQGLSSLLKGGAQAAGTSLLGGGGGMAGLAPAAPLIEGATAVPASGALASLGGGLGTAAGFALPAAAAGYAGWRAMDDYNKMKKDPSFGTGFSNAIKNPANIPLNAMTFGGYSLAQGLLGAGMDAFGSGKNEGQMQRDSTRDFLKKQGLFGDDYQYSNPGGSGFDFGKDGGATLANSDGSTRNFHEIDLKNPLATQAIDFTNPLAEIATNGGKDSDRAAWTGEFSNAALAGGDPLANTRAMYDKLNIDRSEAQTVITRLAREKKITDEEKNVYLSNINKVFGNDESKPNAATPAAPGRAAPATPAAPAPEAVVIPPGGYDRNISYILPSQQVGSSISPWAQLGGAAAGSLAGGLGQSLGPQLGSWLGGLF